MAVAARRYSLGPGFNIKSDCAALQDLLLPLLKKIRAVKFMRDPTRGGIAAVLNEIAAGSRPGMFIREKDIPVSTQVRAACELLGLDPLYVACEGRAVIVVAAAAAQKALGVLRRNPLGAKARIIGEVTRANKGKVILETVAGTQRFVDMPSGELLPRIC
jgi:hydrogenase expression/formation protein HypE